MRCGEGTEASMSQNETTIEVEVNCCLCSADTKHTITLPPGWALKYGGLDAENGFCPKHSIIKQFSDSQCPGCVGGWGDCSLWNAFAYNARGRNLNEADFASLAKGICPKRVNGTIGIRNGRREDLDLSDRAPPEAGAALAQAIRDYWETYK